MLFFDVGVVLEAWSCQTKTMFLKMYLCLRACVLECLQLLLLMQVLILSVLCLVAFTVCTFVLATCESSCWPWSGLRGQVLISVTGAASDF